MKIFISWSGPRSEAIAKALREWFPLVLHFVEPWLSQSDIQAGERWSIEVAKELGNCNFGVLCITRENLLSPWILFEAGALAKSMQDGRVIPLLLDLDFKEISGPLAQFQAKKTDISGIRELVESLNKAYSAPVPSTQLDRLFAALWPDLEKRVSEIPANVASSKHSRPQGEILEELVSSVRSVELRVRDAIDDDPNFKRRRRPRFHPMMLEEIIHRVCDGPRDPLHIIVFASFFRDEAPWFYEIALEAYRSIQSNGRENARKTVRKFLEAFEMLQRGPLSEALGLDRSIFKMMRYEFMSAFEFPDVEDEPIINVGRRKEMQSNDEKAK